MTVIDEVVSAMQEEDKHLASLFVACKIFPLRVEDNRWQW